MPVLSNTNLGHLVSIYMLQNNSKKKKPPIKRIKWITIQLSFSHIGADPDMKCLDSKRSNKLRLTKICANEY